MNGVLYSAINGVKDALKLKALDGVTDTTAQAMLDEWDTDLGENGTLETVRKELETAYSNLFPSDGILLNNKVIKSIHKGDIGYWKFSSSNPNVSAEFYRFPNGIDPAKSVVFTSLLMGPQSSSYQVTWDLTANYIHSQCWKLGTNTQVVTVAYSLYFLLIEFY